MTKKEEVVENSILFLGGCYYLQASCWIFLNTDLAKTLLSVLLYTRREREASYCVSTEKEKAIKKLKAAFDAFSTLLMRYDINEFTLKSS